MAFRYVRDVLRAAVPTLVAAGGLAYYHISNANKIPAEYEFHLDFDSSASLGSDAALANTAAPSNAEYGGAAFNVVRENVMKSMTECGCLHDNLQSTIPGNTTAGSNFSTDVTSFTEGVPLWLALIVLVFVLSLFGLLFCVHARTRRHVRRAISHARARISAFELRSPDSIEEFSVRLFFWFSWISTAASTLAIITPDRVSRALKSTRSTCGQWLLAAILALLFRPVVLGPAAPVGPQQLPPQGPNPQHGGGGPPPNDGPGPNGDSPDPSSKPPSGDNPQTPPTDPQLPDTSPDQSESPAGDDETERWFDAPENPIDDDEQLEPPQVAEPCLKPNRLVVKKKPLSIEVVRYERHLLVRHSVSRPHQTLPRITYRPYMLKRLRAILVPHDKYAVENDQPSKIKSPRHEPQHLGTTRKCLRQTFSRALAAKEKAHSDSTKELAKALDAVKAELLTKQEAHKAAIKEMAQSHDATKADLAAEQKAHKATVKEMTESHNVTKAKLTASNETSKQHLQRFKELEAKLSKSNKELVASRNAYDLVEQKFINESQRNADYAAGMRRLEAFHESLEKENFNFGRAADRAREEAIRQRLRAEAFERMDDNNQRTIAALQQVNKSSREEIDTLQAQLRDSKEQINKLRGELNTFGEQNKQLSSDIKESFRSRKAAVEALGRQKGYADKLRTTLTEKEKSYAANTQALKKQVSDLEEKAISSSKEWQIKQDKAVKAAEKQAKDLQDGLREKLDKAEDTAKLLRQAQEKLQTASNNANSAKNAAEADLAVLRLAKTNVDGQLDNERASNKKLAEENEQLRKELAVLKTKQPGPDSPSLDQTGMVDAAVQTDGPKVTGSAPPENGQGTPSKPTAAPAPGPAPPSAPSVLGERSSGDVAKSTDNSTANIFTFSGNGQSKPARPSSASSRAPAVAPALPGLSKSGGHGASAQTNDASGGGEPAPENEDCGRTSTLDEIADRKMATPRTRQPQPPPSAPAPAPPVLKKPDEDDAAGETDGKSTKDVVASENRISQPSSQKVPAKPATGPRQRPIDSPLRAPVRVKPPPKLAPPRSAQNTNPAQSKPGDSGAGAPTGGSAMDGVEKAPSQPTPFLPPTGPFDFGVGPQSTDPLSQNGAAAGGGLLPSLTPTNGVRSGPPSQLRSKPVFDIDPQLLEGLKSCKAAGVTSKPDIEMDDAENDPPVPSESTAPREQTSKSAAGKPQSVVEKQIEKLEKDLADLEEKRYSTEMELEGYTRGHEDTAPGKAKDMYAAFKDDAKKTLEKLDREIAEVKAKLEKLKRHTASKHPGGGPGKGDDDDGDDGPEDGGFPGSGNGGDAMDLDDCGNGGTSNEIFQPPPSNRRRTGGGPTDAEDQEIGGDNGHPVDSTALSNITPLPAASLEPSPSGTPDRLAPPPLSLVPMVRRSGQGLRAMNGGGIGMGRGGTTRLFRRQANGSPGPLVREPLFPQAPPPSGLLGLSFITPNGGGPANSGASVPTKSSNGSENALPALFAGMAEKIKRFNEIQDRMRELNQRRAAIDSEIVDSTMEADMAKLMQDAVELKTVNTKLSALNQKLNTVDKEIIKLQAEEQALNGQPNNPDSTGSGNGSEETVDDDEGYDSEDIGSGTRPLPSKPVQRGEHGPLKPIRRRRQAGPPPAPDATAFPDQPPSTDTPFAGLPETEGAKMRRLEGELEVRNEELKNLNGMIAVWGDLYEMATDAGSTQEAADYKQKISDKKSERAILEQDIQILQEQLEELKKVMDE